MEYWKYRVSTLRLMNLLAVTILLWFASLYHKYHSPMDLYFYVVLLLSICVLVVAVSMSFFSKIQSIYHTLLSIAIWGETIILTDIALLIRFGSAQLVLFLLLLVAIFSVFNLKVLQQVSISYILCVVPFILISPYQNSDKVVFISIIIILMLLAYMKNLYEFKLFKAYEASSKYQFLLLENANEAFALHEIILDGSGGAIDYLFLDVNKAFETLTGLTKSQIIGKTVLEILPQTEWFWIKEYGEVVEKGIQKTLLNYSKAFDKWFEVTAYPVNQRQFAVLFTDVTQKLDHEQQIQNAIKISENAIQLKNQFLRDVNHRLRTPLNGMMGMMQLIDSDTLSGETKELFEAMALEMKHSRNIINQISKYVEIQSKQLEYEKYNVFEVLTTELAELNQDNSMITLKDPTVKMDSFYLEKSILTSVFKELMTNAILHTKNEKVTIELDLNILLQQTEDVILSINVTDYGDGMDDEKLKFIFNEFYHHDFISIYREDDRISLPMCKQLLKSCGGDLFVESDEGERTSFIMKIPVYYSNTHRIR